MSSAKEAAQNAIALLEDALQESEDRLTELDAQLKQKRPSKNQLEKKLEVIGHRLATVEEERDRWLIEAAHLEEVVAAEQSKVTKLKKKLEVAESGPDKLSKKEINYWKTKIEDFDAEAQEYKQKIADLMNQLKKRSDALTTAETRLEHARAKSDKLATELKQAKQQQEAAAETVTAAQQAAWEEERQALVASRDAVAQEFAELIATRDAWEEERESLVTSRDAAGQELAEIIATRDAWEGERENLVTSRDAAGQELAEIIATRDAWEVDRDQLEQEKRHATDQLADLERRLGEQSEQRAAAAADLASKSTQLEQLSIELEHVRDKLADRDLRLAELNATLGDAETRVMHVSSELSGLRAAASATEADAETITRLKDDLVRTQAQFEGLEDELQSATASRDASRNELEQAQRRIKDLNREIEQARHQTNITQSEIDTLRTTLESKAAELTEAKTQWQELQAHMAEGRDQFAGIEEELAAEKTESDRLAHMATERLERAEKAEEAFELANQRVRDFEQQLGQSGRFKRIAARRTTLAKRLLDELRTKKRTNETLKAGIDGLRKFKTTAEETNHQLGARVQKHKLRLQETQFELDKTLAALEQASDTQASTAALTQSQSHIKELVKRLGAQSELIDTLEADSKSAKSLRKDLTTRNDEIERLGADLHAKTQIIVRLQADIDNQQRKVAKLRGSDSETARLRGLANEDQDRISALESENTELKRRTASTPEAVRELDNAALEQLNAKVKSQKDSIAQLQAALKKQETELKAWKRKYEFLAAEDGSGNELFSAAES